MRASAKSTLLLSLSLLGATALTPSAHALEGLELFELMLSQGEAKVTWEKAVESGSDSFTLTNVKIADPENRITTVQSFDVKGLRDQGVHRINFESMVMSGLSGATDNGGTVVISNLAMNAASVPTNIWKKDLSPEEKKQRVTFGSFSINGVEVNDEGNLVKLESMAMSDADISLDFRFDDETMKDTSPPSDPVTFGVFSLTGLSGNGNGVTWSLGSISMKDFRLPTTMNAPFTDWLIYSSFSLNDIKTNLGGQSLFSLGSMVGTIDKSSDGNEVSSKSAITDMMVNLKAIPDPKAQAVAAQLGYDKVEANLLADGVYDLTTGRAAVDNMVLTLKDMFDLNMAYAIDGYTQEVAQQIMALQMKAATSGEQPDFMMFLPVLSKIKLETIKINLTDKSLLGRVLDFQAQQMGTTGEQLAQGAPMMIGMGMAPLQMPELTSMVTTAVGKFLTDKGSLLIDATPEKPVPVMDLVINSQSNPQALPGMLNLKISAR